jgi:hypothetical protein
VLSIGTVPLVTGGGAAGIHVVTNTQLLWVSLRPPNPTASIWARRPGSICDIKTQDIRGLERKQGNFDRESVRRKRLNRRVGFSGDG